MSDNTIRLHDFIYAYIDGEGFGCFSWEPRAYTTEYVRADVAAAQLAERDARIAELEAAQRWISIDEWLPEPLTDVLVTDGDGTTVGWLSQNGIWNAYAWSRADVTHWMPLPPPPIAHVEHEC